MFPFLFDQSARPVMIDARSKKSTWMPSLAPEFVAQNNFGKRPVSQEKRASPRYAVRLTIEKLSSCFYLLK